LRLRKFVSLWSGELAVRLARPHYCISYVVSVILHGLLFVLVHVGSTEVIVYSAQGVNDPVTSAMHIIFGNVILF